MRNILPHRTEELVELGANLALFVLWKGHQDDPVFSATQNGRANYAGADDAHSYSMDLGLSTLKALDSPTTAYFVAE